MSTARHHKLIASGPNASAADEMTLHLATATSVLDPSAWTAGRARNEVARVPPGKAFAGEERRAYARANLSLPLRVKRIAGQRERIAPALRTKNVSSSGVLFLAPARIEPGTPIELEVSLLDRPMGRGSVKMLTQAHIVRVEPAARSGWFALAASFDEITFQREEPIPSRFTRQ